MGCYEFQEGCCGCSVRNTVCFALCHFMIHGIFVVSFAFSNICYPPFYLPDYVYGGSGACLTVVSFLTAWLVDAKKCQFLRVIFCGLTALVVVGHGASTYYYTILRWNDIMVTLLTNTFRRGPLKSYPDKFWNALAVVSCIHAIVFLFYMVYILSFMCHTWKSHLFTSPYRNNQIFTSVTPPISVPTDTYSTRQYKPYPRQN